MSEQSIWKPYTESLTDYVRRKSRVVQIGDVPLGGEYPIRVQSMTTTDTLHTEATVAQSIRMIEAGCEYVRITAPSIHEANNLAEIKKSLRAKGYKTPLVADIHFTPNAAEIAARIVEKVRINPGNFADKKKFEEINYTDAAYDAELERIRERFVPLVRICKEYGTAMRIGTNHGSLSDRIMSRYGDTAHGMVESALEFLRICEDENYYNIVLSMKSSNPQVMVQAYRLLISRMDEAGMHYPLHLGVTEAGEGEDGRIKSAAGIGTLLEDGIGDTVRVSLTEDPEFEIPVARALVERYTNRRANPEIRPVDKLTYSPFEYTRRSTTPVANVGGAEVPRVVGDLSKAGKLTPASLFGVGYNYAVALDKWNLTDLACDVVYTGTKLPDFEVPGTLRLLVDASVWIPGSSSLIPLFTAKDYLHAMLRSPEMNWIRLSAADIFSATPFDFKLLDDTTVIVLETHNDHGMADQRRCFVELMNRGCTRPVIIRRSYSSVTPEQVQLMASTDLGALLLDGFGDGVWIDTNGEVSPQFLNSLSFGILQAARTRISKTEYISCPSCGRTLFDLQETTAKIRSRTDHLKGIKIGIMGCIVNGPGEMADADYGYVGSGPGKITLYKGREVVRRSIDAAEAVDALIDLIRSYGDWVEKESVQEA